LVSTLHIFLFSIQICNVSLLLEGEILQKSPKTSQICNVSLILGGEILQKSSKTSQICNVSLLPEGEILQKSSKTIQICNVSLLLEGEILQKSIKTSQICKEESIIKNYLVKTFDINGEVDKRIQYLEKQLSKYEEIYSKMPEGSLLVAPGCTENSFRYYNRRSLKDKQGIYLDKSQLDLKQQLATKKYHKILIKNVKTELVKLKKLKGIMLSDSIIETYDKLNNGIKKLIEPYNIDDELLKEIWESEKYEGLGFDENDDSSFYSDNNERMRSKSEVLIANALIKREIPYKYECPVNIGGGKNLYPDFTILDVKNRRLVYWEHLGKMGDLSYVSKNLWKMNEYKKVDIYMGINLYISFESEIQALGTKEISKIIEAIIG